MKSKGFLLALALVASLAGVSSPQNAAAYPAATNDTLYAQFHRVFPDPHGCTHGAPGTSPWAKGAVCAVQFLQFDEVIQGMRYLEQRFPDFVDLIDLHQRMAGDPSFSASDTQSAGLPKEDLTRDKRDLYVIKVTDRTSPIPEVERKHFAYSLSIHGIERAGVEGGIRAAEDLVTWAACERKADASPSCADEKISPSSPKHILEAFTPPQGPTGGEVLRNAVVYFVLSNPDGWHRGEVTNGDVAFQRYNGNGMDVNRDFPTIGYTEAQYTPGSEPETRGYTKFLSRERANTAEGHFDGGIDLHGMLSSHSFSFTLLGAGQRDYRKNAITVQTATTAFRDSETRLVWNPLVAKAGSCPGQVPEPYFGRTWMPMCTDQWGTVWDTINYQVTGSFGDWMDSPMGLDAVGIDNEMALSHLYPNTVFDPALEQLHIDANKGLVYAQIAALLNEKPVTYRPPGRIGYVFDSRRVRSRGASRARSPLDGLPVQDLIEHTDPNGIADFAFDVLGPGDRVHDGGMTIEATFGNVRGISPNTQGDLILDYCGPGEHPGDRDGECREVAHYFNQGSTYVQAGARIDLTDPRPGPYRIRAENSRVLPTTYRISFSKGDPTLTPKQRAYDASRMDFFRDLNKYVPAGNRLQPVTVDRVLALPGALSAYDTLVVTGDFMPGYRAKGSSRYTRAQLAAYVKALRAFAARGGTLVLTDGALTGLGSLGVNVDSSDVRRGYFYAGWMDFSDGTDATYGKSSLAKGVDAEGTAEGWADLGGTSFRHRHQTFEPVPLGYYIGPSGSGNADCSIQQCDSPNWIVDPGAWAKAGGTTAARTYVRSSTQPGKGAGTLGVSLGEVRLGRGVVRIAGALFPDPYERNYHPFGLASYALTYTGYQLFENLVRPVTRVASRRTP